MEIKDVFPVGVLFHRLDSTLADELEERLLPWVEKLEMNGDDYDYRHSDFWDTKIPIHEVAPEITDAWLECIEHYKEVTHIDAGDSLHYWTQDYQEGEGHDIHGHGINGISGIYWLRANENAGMLRLYNPNLVAEYVKNTDPNSPYFAAQLDVKVEKGKLILFPSYLKHKVIVPHNANVIRTSIPFNLAC